VGALLLAIHDGRNVSTERFDRLPGTAHFLRSCAIAPWGLFYRGLNRLPTIRCDLDHSELAFLGSWVIGADMQPKLFVALQLEIARHFIDRRAGEWTRLKLPLAFGTTKTPKILLLDPFQLPVHGCLSCCGVAKDAFRTGVVYMRQFGRSVGQPT